MSPMASVSVVIPCFNCAGTIVRAVESVACQSMLPLEVILVDDCSGDNTLNVLYMLRERFGECWIKVLELSENAGPGTARNVGWDFASGRYIAFLDSDDRWHSQKIEIQYGWMERNPGVALVGHLMAVDDGGEEDFFDPVSVSPVQVRRCLLLTSNPFSTPTVMVRRDISQRFASGARYSEDYRLWLHVCLVAGECYRFERVLAYMYKAPYGAAGLSARLWDMERGELATYWDVYRLGGVNVFGLFFCVGLSLLKFVRRIFLVLLR